MYGKVVEDIRDLIGQTPLLRIRGFGIPEGVRVYAKLEYLNPGGSVKDRTCLTMLQEAESKKILVPGATIIEPTAGNTGIGLALAALGKGYRVIFVVPEKFSQEKQELMRALGAEIINTPTANGIEGAIAKAKELATSMPTAIVLNQFYNLDNPLAHYLTTGPEIYHQLQGQIDVFIAGVGSGGTFTGTAKYLKEHNPEIIAVAVEPEGSVLKGGTPGSHRTEGIGVEFIGPTMDMSLVDRVATIKDDDAFNMVQQLAIKVGALVGSSSGAAFYAAVQIAANSPEGTTIVTIFPDSSERYLSKNIYQGGI